MMRGSWRRIGLEVIGMRIDGGGKMRKQFGIGGGKVCSRKILCDCGGL